MGTFEIEPTSEMHVREWFLAHLGECEYSIAESGTAYPDYVLVDASGQMYRVEAEYESANFIAHGHDPQGCDFILCWRHTQVVPLPVLELSTGTMYPKAAQPAQPREVSYSSRDARAEKAGQLVREKVGDYPEILSEFYNALAADMRARSAYQSMLTAPRLALQAATQALLRVIGEKDMDPYDLLRILAS